MGKRKLDSALDGESDEKEKSLKSSDGGASDEEYTPEVKVVGEVIKKAGGKLKGDKGRKMYQAFEVDGNRYDVDDPVLVTPERTSQKPYVAIIKKVMQAKDGTVQIEGQWFYRPEEAEKKGGGTWASSDSRELFYSFHIDEVPAESVMHKCQVHFIPPNKQLPLRHKHPGFIVRRVYDACEKKLFNLTDKDYEDPMQQEIDLLVQKTRDALGDLLDIDADEPMAPADEEVVPDVKVKRKVPAKRTVAPLNLKGEEFSLSDPKVQADTPTTGKADTTKAETPTSTVGTDSEVSTLLRNHGVLLSVHARDRWLEKLVQTIRDLCGGGKGFNSKNGGDEPSSKDDGDASKGRIVAEAEGGKQRLGRRGSFLGEGELAWPEVAPAAVEVASALERLSHDSLGNDLHKYNLKMRQLDFNVKNNKVLARRLLSKELEPAKVINMTPAELKDGYIAAEREDQEPPEPETMQMADVRCSICTEREVGVIDIIHVGYGDRYQLECMKCGNTWYSSRDAISSLVIKTAGGPPNVGIAPWATSKFDEVEKDIQSGSVTPDADNSSAATVIETKSPRDAKPPTPHHTRHYEEVENILNEHLSVANPAVEELVSTNPQAAGATEEKQDKHTGIDTENTKSKPPPPEVTTDSKSEPEKSHVDGATGSALPEKSATDGTTQTVEHSA
ncbi:hypothetical protein M758_6G190200 [Ceratodon purpureus]|nr:hypothetical protein M758_6G190200 [Ceratodon purpureus]